VFPASAQGDSGPLPDRLDPNTFEFYGQISLLKAGISWSDRLTTVSPTYAREILTPEYGCGLDGLLRHRSNDLLGILNGADYHVWDPGSDALIPASFTVRNPAGKRFCKAALQAEFGLNQDADTPIVAFMSRVSDQKMADVVAQSLADIADMGAQCVILGDGDRRISDEFDRVAQRHAGRVSARTGYEETLAHLVLAGGDILLHPARFEPCGLTQLYAMRYGTLPVVRSTGGLSDTVVDAGDEAITNGTATGFAFAPPERGPMLACLGRAIEFYQQPLAWRRVQRHAMAQDFSWEKSARRYLALYRTLVSGFEPDCAAAPEVVLEKAAG
jgi:starch synthase